METEAVEELETEVEPEAGTKNKHKQKSNWK